MKKEAKRVDFIQIKPCKDPVFEKEMAKLKLRNLIDQFILPHNSFIEVNSDEVNNNNTIKDKTAVKIIIPIYL